jgi:hypothetical protein
MSSSQNPARGNDAPQNAAPPASQPPQYTEVPIIELRDDEAASSSHTNLGQQRNGPTRPPPPPPGSGSKPEASSYVGSYRPSDAQTPIPSVNNWVRSSCADTSKEAHPQSHNLTMARISGSTKTSTSQQTPTSLHLHTPNFLANSTTKTGWVQTR